MNSLSWLLYLADVAGSVANIGTAIAIGAGLGGVISVVATTTKVDWDNIGKSEKRPALATGWQSGKGFFKVAIITCLVLIPLPSSTTIYAIAASEMGEEALKSDTGNKAVQALNAWLDRQIAGEPEASE